MRPIHLFTIGTIAAVLSCSKLESDKSATVKVSDAEKTSAGIYYTCKQPASLVQNVTPGYEDQIKPIFDRSCFVCHGAGGETPVLATYDLAKMVAQDIKRVVNANIMPKEGGPLPQSEKDIISAWVDGGTPEFDGGPPSDGGSSGGGSTPDVICDPKQEAVLNTKGVKACHKEGLLYDHNRLSCSDATTKTGYPCTYAGIERVFADYGVSVTETLVQALGDPNIPGDIGDGFSIDQCGRRPNGTPIVFLVKEEGPLESLELKVRVLTTKSPHEEAEGETAPNE